MEKLKIGLLKETKVQPDRRAALTPVTARKMVEKFSNIELKIQPSKMRAFSDQEYINKGLRVVEDVSDCDILIGIKEVKEELLLKNKTYMFFSHTAKKQPYNKSLLKSVLTKNIRLIDYEYLTNEQGFRIVAFGRWAGIVGSYNGLRTFGLRTGNFNLKRAIDLKDKSEMFLQLSKIKIAPIKIAITGGGRVAAGATETLKAANVEEVSVEEFLNKTYSKPVYAKIEPQDYVKHNTNKEFELSHFFNYPKEYQSTFERYCKVADLYVACHFWNPHSPQFITQDIAKAPDFKMKVIADVSCDIKQPIAPTIRASTIAQPFYDYNPQTAKEEPAFSNDANITVMAIDNLPGELPRDASEDFSNTLIDKVFEHLITNDRTEIIKRATITKNGKLTENFKYLADWVKK